MRIKTALYNTDHLEYGIVTIPFPIPKDQYDSTIKMLEALDIGDPRERDCAVKEILGPVPSLKLLEGTQINVDELDYRKSLSLRKTKTDRVDARTIASSHNPQKCCAFEVAISLPFLC